MELEELLNSTHSKETERELQLWIRDMENKILRGDMIIGILTEEDVAGIPDAYRKLIEWGNDDAIMHLASWYTYPKAGSPDLQQADDLYKQAAEKGIAGAEYAIARMRYFSRRNEISDDEKTETFDYLDKEQYPTSESLYLKGLFYEQGFGTELDYKKAIETFKLSADKGNADAMFELYVIYSSGMGVEVDTDIAFEYNKKAAERSQDRALYNMGAFYATGRYVERDINKSVEYYKLASDEGNAKAAYTLAMMYAQGGEIKQDLEAASEYFDQAEYLGFDSIAIRFEKKNYGIG